MRLRRGRAARRRLRVRVRVRVWVAGLVGWWAAGERLLKGPARRVLAENGPKSVDFFLNNSVQKNEEKKY